MMTTKQVGVDQHIKMSRVRFLGRLLCLSIWICGLQSSAEAADSIRVLFVGNSYTGQIRGTLLKMVEDSSNRDSVFEFITPGGCTLERHLGTEETVARINEGNWDYVVLQDQSQTPALPGTPGDSFQQSVDEFSKIIRHSGAEPILYMTWGRRDGDKQNSNLFPDFTVMQDKLTAAYEKAAKRNRVKVAPVGEVWEAVRDRNRELGSELYKDDGSHPSVKGACLASCVFMRTLFADSLIATKPVKGVSVEEFNVIRAAVK